MVTPTGRKGGPALAIALISLLLMGQDAGSGDAEWSVTVVDRSLLAYQHGEEVSLGQCVLTVDLANHTNTSLEVTFEPLDILDASGDLFATCSYERATVWESTVLRRRYARFDMGLAANEQLQVRAFYRFDGDSEARPREPLRYRTAFNSELGTLELTTDGFGVSELSF